MDVLFFKAPRSIPVTFNYSDALAKSILFYKAQRSGIFNDGDSVPWRIGFSGTDNKLDHAGGWYDGRKSFHIISQRAHDVN